MFTPPHPLVVPALQYRCDPVQRLLGYRLFITILTRVKAGQLPVPLLKDRGIDSGQHAPGSAMPARQMGTQWGFALAEWPNGGYLISIWYLPGFRKYPYGTRYPPRQLVGHFVSYRLAGSVGCALHSRKPSASELRELTYSERWLPGTASRSGAAWAGLRQCCDHTKIGQNGVSKPS